MSRGPGRIERAIRALFDAHPDLAFVTDELAEHCYPDAGTIERKHQVAVLRAAWNVIEHDPNWTAWRIDAQGNGWVFCNRDSAMSSACASEIAKVIYRSEKRAARKRYDWVQRDGCRFRLPYGTVLEQWAARYYERPFEPGRYERRVWQHHDLCQWRDSDAGHNACADRAGDVAWHRVCRDSDDATLQALLAAEHEIWLRGPGVWREWQTAKATWASKPEVWLKRYPAAGTNGKETHTGTIIPPTDLSRLADRLRALAVQNDPDVVRSELREIADALDQAGGRDAPILDEAAD